MRPSQSGRRAGRVLGAVGAGLGGIAVSMARVGVVGTLLAVAATVVVLVGFLRLYPYLYQRHAKRELSDENVALVAEASLDREPGSVTVLRDRLEFISRRSRTRVCVFKKDVVTAQLVAVSPIVKATRARMTMGDGKTIDLVVTASVDLMKEALSAH